MRMLAVIVILALTLAPPAKCGEEISGEKSPKPGDSQTGANQPPNAKPEETAANQRYLLGEILPKTVMNPKSAEELSLTKEQTESLQSELGKIKPEIEKLKVELEKSAVKQAKLITDSKINEKELMAAVETTGKIRIEIAKLQVKQVLVVLKTLTPEQIEKAKQITQQTTSKHRKTPASNETQPKGKGRDDKEKSKIEAKEELPAKENVQSDQ